MKFNEWTKNKSRNIDNDELSEFEIQKVFLGETLELVEAFGEFCHKPNVSTLGHFFEEVFDVVQATLGLIRRVRRISNKNTLSYEVVATQATTDHNNKILDRGWQIDLTKEVNIEVIDHENDRLED